jgi:hypothetical protein
MKLTELPKYWVVKCDGSQLFKDTVIKYLNDTFRVRWGGCITNSYYGYDDNCRHKGTNENYKLEHFQNNPVELTLEQFITLTTKDMQEIIGYKLKDEFTHLKEAVVKMSDAVVYPLQGYYTPKGNYKSIDSFTKAGVLDLWFDKVYKEDEYRVGDWVIGWESEKSPVIKLLSKSDYGFTCSYKGQYRNLVEQNISIGNIQRKATQEEIKNNLVDLAKEKGFTKEVNFTAVRDTIKGDLRACGDREGSVWDKELAKCGSTFVYDNTTDTLLTSGFGLFVVYENGVWATIEPQETVVSVGGKFDVTIKDGRIYHKFDDITTFVKDLVGVIGEKTYGGYKAKVIDVVFEYTGCQKVETKLSDWKKVLDTYNKLNS